MPTTTNMSIHPDNVSLPLKSQSDQFLTFILNDEEYGVDILSVVEIRGMEKTTPIPSAPPFIKGVINLRGTIIPVMDLKERFNMTTTKPSSILVVLQLKDGTQRKEIGILVDAVSDVYKISSEEIKEKPDFCNTTSQEYIQGLVTILLENKTEKLIIILDVDKLINIGTLHNTKDNTKDDIKEFK